MESGEKNRSPSNNNPRKLGRTSRRTPPGRVNLSIPASTGDHYLLRLEAKKHKRLHRGEPRDKHEASRRTSNEQGHH